MPMRAVSVLSAALLQECRYRLKVGADKTLCSLRLELFYLHMLREYVDSSGHLNQLRLVSIQLVFNVCVYRMFCKNAI